MADFSALKTAIQTYIKQNGNEEITGDILQEILLSVVTTLGDSAINDLVTALNDEVAARQNADGTLQQNITNEATARGNADTALGGRIDDEATARANGDMALSNRLGSTITAENTAADQIGAEAEARAAADTALQELIDGITDNIENGYVYAGIATPSSTPTTGKVFYLALTAGTYTNFGSTVVSQGINILKYNGSAWSLDTFVGIDDTPTPNSPNLVKSGGAFDSVMTNGSAFDISAHFASGGTLATYADLSAALNALDTLSASYKRGGMSIKYVQSSDNNYLQYRLIADSFTTDVTKWAICDDDIYVEDAVYLRAITDKAGKILWGIDKNGNIRYGAGVPKQVRDFVSSAIFDLDIIKVDKEIGKSLIDAEFASSIELIDNPIWMKCILDSEGNIIAGITHNREVKIYGTLNINGVELSSEILLEERANTIKSNWSGKQFWWCGTSIPAGGDWDVNNKRSYPLITGKKLNAKRVFNEAVSSSCARKRVTENVTYGEITRQMGNSIADALEIVADLWTINDANQTFSNGPRTKGITNIPTVSSYAAVCQERYFILSNSYEIKLISKYLISDTAENEAFLRAKFGQLYSTLTSLHPYAFSYQGDIDLFVIDHGHNDIIQALIPEEDLDSRDITTFVGAINTYISLIYQYKPHARIMFISDYDDLATQIKTIEVQEQIARHWHIPFIDLRNHLPFNNNIKVKVRGYWGIDGTWKENGFTYNSEAESIATAFAENGNAYFSPLLGNTVQQVAANILPEQDGNGVWWYSISPKFIWIKDGTHPDTDISGKCLQFYSKILAQFINQN